MTIHELLLQLLHLLDLQQLQGVQCPEHSTGHVEGLQSRSPPWTGGQTPDEERQSWTADDFEERRVFGVVEEHSNDGERSYDVEHEDKDWDWSHTLEKKTLLSPVV